MSTISAQTILLLLLILVRPHQVRLRENFPRELRCGTLHVTALFLRVIYWNESYLRSKKGKKSQKPSWWEKSHQKSSTFRIGLLHFKVLQSDDGVEPIFAELGGGKNGRTTTHMLLVRILPTPASVSSAHNLLFTVYRDVVLQSAEAPLLAWKPRSESKMAMISFWCHLRPFSFVWKFQQLLKWTFSRKQEEWLRLSALSRREKNEMEINWRRKSESKPLNGHCVPHFLHF